MPPTPHPKTPSPLIIVVWESVPTSESGIREHARVRAIGEDDGREILEIDLVNDPRVRRDDAKIAKGRLAPAQKCVPLLIALEFEACVDQERRIGTVFVDLYGMIDH